MSNTVETYRVVARKISTGDVARVMATGKTKRNADAICDMAVMRRGCDAEYYTVELETSEDGHEHHK